MLCLSVSAGQSLAETYDCIIVYFPQIRNMGKSSPKKAFFPFSFSSQLAAERKCHIFPKTAKFFQRKSCIFPLHLLLYHSCLFKQESW